MVTTTLIYLFISYAKGKPTQHVVWLPGYYYYFHYPNKILRLLKPISYEFGDLIPRNCIGEVVMKFFDCHWNINNKKSLPALRIHWKVFLHTTFFWIKPTKVLLFVTMLTNSYFPNERFPARAGGELRNRIH